MKEPEIKKNKITDEDEMEIDFRIMENEEPEIVPIVDHKPGIPYSQFTWNLPEPTGNFVKESSLKKIEESLPPKKTSERRLVIIKGAAGIGKSRAVLEYCKRAGSRYNSLMWFPAENLNRLYHSYFEFCIWAGIIQLDTQGKDSDKIKFERDDIRNKIIDYLNVRTNLGRPFLLIYDNLDSVGNDIEKEDLIEIKNSDVLITSRNLKIEDKTIFLSGSLHKEELDKVFGSLTKPCDANYLICTQVQKTIEYVAKYKEENFESYSKKWLELNKNKMTIGHAFQANVDFLAKFLPYYKDLQPIVDYFLSIMIYLQPERISPTLLIEWLERQCNDAPDPSGVAKNLFKQCLKILSGCGILSGFEEEKDCKQISLFHPALRDHINLKFVRIGQSNFHALSIQIVDHLIQQASQRKEVYRLLPHLEAAFERLMGLLSDQKRVTELTNYSTERFVYSKFQSIVLLKYIAIFYYALKRHDSAAVNLKLAEKLLQFYSRQVEFSSSEWSSEGSRILELEKKWQVPAIQPTNSLLFKDSKNSPSYISVPSKIASELIGSSFIIMVWVKISKGEIRSDKPSRLIVGNNEFKLSIENGYYQWKFLNKITSIKISDEDYDCWVHLCGQYNHFERKITLFYKAINSSTNRGVESILSESNDRLYLGGQPEQISSYNIQLKDVVLLRTALSIGDIMEILCKPQTLEKSKKPIIAYWRLDEGAGDKVYDNHCSMIENKLSTGTIFGKSNLWLQSDIPEFIPDQTWSKKKTHLDIRTRTQTTETLPLYQRDYSPDEFLSYSPGSSPKKLPFPTPIPVMSMDSKASALPRRMYYPSIPSRLDFSTPIPTIERGSSSYLKLFSPSPHLGIRTGRQAEQVKTSSLYSPLSSSPSLLPPQQHLSFWSPPKPSSSSPHLDIRTRRAEHVKTSSSYSPLSSSPPSLLPPTGSSLSQRHLSKAPDSFKTLTFD
jgi:hypothetical protein